MTQKFKSTGLGFDGEEVAALCKNIYENTSLDENAKPAATYYWESYNEAGFLVRILSEKETEFLLLDWSDVVKIMNVRTFLRLSGEEMFDKCVRYYR